MFFAGWFWRLVLSQVASGRKHVANGAGDLHRVTDRRSVTAAGTVAISASRPWSCRRRPLSGRLSARGACGKERVAEDGGPKNHKLVAMVLKTVERSVPTKVTAVIMTTAINDAIKPYSIAVTPFLSSTINNLAKYFVARFAVKSWIIAVYPVSCLVNYLYARVLKTF